MKTSLPIARLRALGCKVSTVIGHDPRIADFIYSVRTPDSVGDLRENLTDDMVATRGRAIARVPGMSDGHHITVMACSYRGGQLIPDQATRDENERDVAWLLSAIADVLIERKVV